MRAKARMSSAEKLPRRRRVLHIFNFRQRFEMQQYARQSGLEFTREFTAAGGTHSTEASQYLAQLTELRHLCNSRFHEAYGLFVELRTLAAQSDRIYRGYLLDADRQPMTEKILARRLDVEPERLRPILRDLVEVRLLERVELPDFPTLIAAEEAENAESEKVSKRSGKVENVSESFKKGKGNGKRKTKAREKPSGNGLEAQEQNNGRKQGQGKQRRTSTTPTTAPPPLPPKPTESDARGPVNHSRVWLNPPWGSVCPQDPMRLDGLLPTILARASPGEPPQRRYSDRAYLFAAEIYTTLGLHGGDRYLVREMACFAARWSEAERADLPPPVESQLWAEAVRQAARIRRKGRARKPGAVWCDIWTNLLCKAKLGTLDVNRSKARSRR